MSLKETLLNIFGIALIVVLPHLELIPNFGYSLPIFLVVWLILKSSDQSFSDLGFSFKRFQLKSILVGILVAAISLSFMQLVFFPILEKLVTFEATEIGLYDFIRGGPVQFVLIVLMGWIIGGFYEEIVFHGFIFTRLERMIGGRYSTAIAVLITAILFGAYHFQLGTAGLLNALIIGAVYLGLFLFYKRNLWYSIICHGAYNTMVMTLIYYGYL